MLALHLPDCPSREPRHQGLLIDPSSIQIASLLKLNLLYSKPSRIFWLFASTSEIQIFYFVR
jgi:hypothetical protein